MKKNYDEFYEECNQDEKIASLHFTHHTKRRNKHLIKVYELYKDLLQGGLRDTFGSTQGNLKQGGGQQTSLNEKLQERAQPVVDLSVSPYG